MLQGIAEQQGQVESGRSELCDHVQVVHQPNNGLAAGQADKARTARKEGSNGIEDQTASLADKARTARCPETASQAVKARTAKGEETSGQDKREKR